LTKLHIFDIIQLQNETIKITQKSIYKTQNLKGDNNMNLNYNYFTENYSSQYNTNDKQNQKAEIINLFDYAKQKTQKTPLDTNINNTQKSKKKKHKAVNGKVNALRTLEQIQRVKDYFLNYNNTVNTNNNSYGIRNYCIFVFGLNTALRASDILSFTIGDVLTSNNRIRNKVTIQEQKTGKKRDVYFNDTLKEALEMYLDTLDNYSLDDYLFPSNKRVWDSEKERYIHQPITVRSLWRIMKQAAIDLGLDKENLNIGTHTMRKTWARLTLLRNKDNSFIMTQVSQALNHCNEKTTYTYADITADEQRELFMTNQL